MSCAAHHECTYLLITRLKVFVPLTQDGLNGWIFKFVCPGNAMSVLHEGLLMLENGTVNIDLGLQDFCKGKLVKILINRYGNVHSWKNGSIAEWPPIRPSLRSSYANMIPYDWEIVKKFIVNNDIRPKWYRPKQNFSYEAKDIFNKTTGMWNGTMGIIQRGAYDFYAVTALDNCKSVESGQAVHFSAPLQILRFHWFSRLPQDLSLTWNLLYLLPKEKDHIYLDHIQF